MFKIFKDYIDKLFDKAREDDFKFKTEEFDSCKDKLEDTIVKTIKEQFASVRSSIEKFKMLEKFNVLKDKKVLQNKINDNFSEVLDS
mmetsp:Transcript_72383/g.156560  ORF Transcript_72383/g.156560 Transcript_72383/m.156560 type:complete len:87 (-) Transcript_72383:407-667(-)